MYNHKKYWLACSGGLDSTFLAHILAIKNVDFGIIHCNFKLRSHESDQDEEFVINLANDLNVPCETKVCKVDPHQNTQLSARKQRYSWFHEIIESGSKVILAHHKDDQEETFWLQLERGAGLAGLVGMSSNHKGFIRPLLKYTKTEILKIAQQNQWTWRDDQSNISTKYKRNFYRLELLPILRDSGISQSFIDDLTADYQTLYQLIQKIKLPETSALKISLWKSYPVILRNELLRRKNIAIHFEKEITKLCSSNKGSKIKITDDYFVWHNGTYLEFVDHAEETKSYKTMIKTVKTRHVDFSKPGLFIDAEKIVGNISTRLWKSGDRFQPLGMKGKKSISDYLTDKKIRSSQKRNIIVLEDEEKIIGVYPFSPSELVKVEANTVSVLYISIKEVSS
jgi:tRNA(Ile)-lysidine synthase